MVLAGTSFRSRNSITGIPSTWSPLKTVLAKVVVVVIGSKGSNSSCCSSSSTSSEEVVAIELCAALE